MVGAIHAFVTLKYQDGKALLAWSIKYKYNTENKLGMFYKYRGVDSRIILNYNENVILSLHQ